MAFISGERVMKITLCTTPSSEEYHLVELEHSVGVLKKCPVARMAGHNRSSVLKPSNSMNETLSSFFVTNVKLFGMCFHNFSANFLLAYSRILCLKTGALPPSALLHSPS